MQVLVSFLISLASLGIHPTTTGSDFEGEWHSPDKKTTVKIYKATNGYWYGKILETKRENNNGKLLLKELSFDKNNQSLVGKVEQPNSPLKASITLSLLENGQLKILAKRYFVRKTLLFDRLTTK